MGVDDYNPPVVPDGYAAVVAAYGDPKISVGPDGKWRVDAAWESANMTKIAHAMIPAAQSGKLYVHKLIAVPLTRVFDRWLVRKQGGDPYALRTIGCFNPRPIRGTADEVSMHTFGIAVDANADANPLISCPQGNPLVIYPPGDPLHKAPGAYDLPDDWIADMKAEGFFWGGEFRHRFDPQHFQLATGC